MFSTSDLQLFCEKTAWKNTKYSRNETILKIRHYAKPIDCKIVALGQKLKFQITGQNLVYKWFTLVRCKNPPEKTRNIRDRNETKIDQRARPIAFSKSSRWFKDSNSKIHVKIYFTSDLKLFCAKTWLKKHSKFQKWEDFQNWASCKAYSLYKIVSLG